MKFTFSVIELKRTGYVLIPHVKLINRFVRQLIHFMSDGIDFDMDTDSFILL